jgi:transcriptional regulator with XRE-family HTH domain
MLEINENVIREKVQRLMKEMGISKKKLGEILGSQGDHVNVRINRANRFLTGTKKKLTLGEINRIAKFFGKPVTWFFYQDNGSGPQLDEAGDQIDKEGVFRSIEKGLRLLGFDESYISARLEELRAVEAYRTAKA